MIVERLKQKLQKHGIISSLSFNENVIHVNMVPNDIQNIYGISESINIHNVNYSIRLKNFSKHIRSNTSVFAVFELEKI